VRARACTGFRQCYDCCEGVKLATAWLCMVSYQQESGVGGVGTEGPESLLFKGVDTKVQHVAQSRNFDCGGPGTH